MLSGIPMNLQSRIRMKSWTYNNCPGGGVIFVSFRSGMFQGDYELVHSTHRSELHDEELAASSHHSVTVDDTRLAAQGPALCGVLRLCSVGRRGVYFIMPLSCVTFHNT